MDFDKYLDLIECGKEQEAILYRMSYIPDVLYKYYPLFENKNEYDIKESEKRLSTLQRGEVYLSSLNQFNDPFEGKAFVFEEDEHAPEGLKKEDLENFVSKMNNKWRIACFANPDEKYQNMPMWAYYANYHRGFCVEYELLDFQKAIFYPVSYNPLRVEGNAFVGVLIMGLLNMYNQKIDSSQMSDELNLYNHLTHLSLTCKHMSWQHEKEYRALLPFDFGSYLPLSPRKIYLGMNCTKEHEQRILEIVQNFPNCELYKMTDTLDNCNFCLKSIRLK